MENFYNDITSMPKKVVAIFDAFITLRDCGADLLGIKVSDIAKAAGIGKGTVYEYFSSKEEIIIKASVYEYCNELKKLEMSICEEESFENKLDSALNWMSFNIKKSFLLLQFIKKEEKFNEASREFCLELMGQEAFELAETAIESIFSSGIKENVIRKPANKMERDMILTGAGAAFMNYLTHLERYSECTFEEAKICAKQMLISSLRPNPDI